MTIARIVNDSDGRAHALEREGAVLLAGELVSNAAFLAGPWAD